jgi:hypothetical protein
MDKKGSDAGWLRLRRVLSAIEVRKRMAARALWRSLIGFHSEDSPRIAK